MALAEVLNTMRRRWAAGGEALGALVGSERRPDILVTEQGVGPVVVETEVEPAHTVEIDARTKLGDAVRSGGVISAAVAVRVPIRFRDASQEELRVGLRSAMDLEYALFTGTSIDDDQRFPATGWLVGSTADLASLIYDASIPEPFVDAAAIELENGVRTAATLLTKTVDKHPDVSSAVSRALRQQDGEQTRRMAMTIVANALVFHESLAGAYGVLNVDELRDGRGALLKTAILDEWRKILDVNYWPIFDIARQVVTPLPQSDAAAILDGLSRTAGSLIVAGLTRSHDLSGSVFQRLVMDRKFLATFYTRPQAATLLTSLALIDEPKWSDPSAVIAYKVADLACGTGTLLSAAYRRIRLLHEHSGGTAEDIHAKMMESSLIGADVMPMSVHLTASMLASAEPEVRFTGTRLFTLPYGRQRNDEEYALGSLDLLREHPHIQPLFRTSAPLRQTGTGEHEVEQHLDVGVGECDLVVMNPPFTRPTNHEGAHGQIPNPAYAAFGADAHEQAEMARLAKSLGRATCANGNAGIASYFVALADRMVRAGGVTAMVLPLAVVQGDSWQRVRDLWRKSYKDLIVVSIAGARSRDKSFSADTEMGEVLVVARHRGKDQAGERGLFVTLERRPETTLEASETARTILRIAQRPRGRRLEDGPYGGTSIGIGQETLGQVLDCPLPEGLPWNVVGISDLSLAQSAWQLAAGRLWLPGIVETAAVEIPMAPLKKNARFGFLHRDINGSGSRGAFDIQAPCSPSATYPTLWGHDAKRERSLVVDPDSEAIARVGREQRAGEIWAARSHTHHNSDFRFNSQSLSVAYTEAPTLGGRSWPNIIFTDERHEVAFALWANTTLGGLCYWWHATKEQSGRGVMPRTQAATMPALDVSQLRQRQLANAVRIFEDMKGERFLPFNEATHDDVRHELDRRVLQEILSLDEQQLRALDLLRSKLCAEPSLHGGKRAKAVQD